MPLSPFEVAVSPPEDPPIPARMEAMMGHPNAKHSIGILIPFFGRLPEMFPLWLQSCRKNPDIDWLILTDDRTPYEYPPNVRVEYTTFEAVREQIASHLGLPIRLDAGWGLCAFRPAYGDIFADRFSGYDWWGYCDLDVVFGSLRTFLTPAVLEANEKILWLGHLSLYRNRLDINEAYRLATPEGEILYERAFTRGDVICFDEDGINRILMNQGHRVYKEVIFADFVHRSFLFRRLYHPGEADVNGRQVFTWEDGRLYHHVLADGRVRTAELLYIHFCRRPMQIRLSEPGRQHSYAIVPNRFIDCPAVVDEAFIRSHTRKRVYWAYWLPRLRPKRLLQSFRRLWAGS